MGGLQMGLGALSSVAVSVLSNNTALPMTGIMALCSVLSFGILMIGQRIIKYQVGIGKEEPADVLVHS